MVRRCVRLRRRSVLLTLLAVMLVAAGCGGGSSGGGGGNGPIKLGLISSLTGNYTPLGTNDKLAVQQAVKEVNASGGVLGRKVQLIVKNDRTEPDKAVIAFNDLANQGVAAVIGYSFSNSSLAVIPQVERKKIPYISTAAADQQVEPVRPYVFMTPQTAGVAAERLLQYFQAEGMRKMAVAYDTKSAFAQTGWNKMKAMAGRYGIDFVTEQRFETTTTDFSSVFTRLRGSGADGLMVWATGAPAVIITKQFASSGLNMKLVMSHAEASTLYSKPAGKAADGVIVASAVGVVGPALPPSQTKDLILKFARPFEKANGYYPPQFAFDGYSAAQILFAAMKKANSTDPAKIQQALNTLTVVTPSGRYRYSPQNHAGLGPESLSVDVIRNGKFQPTDWARAQLRKSLQ